MTKRQIEARKRVRREFRSLMTKARRMVRQYVGEDNYFGTSSLGQLHNVEEKFLDINPLLKK